MPKTYILIESSGLATMVPERDIQRVAAERMVSGHSFQIYLAEPMKLQVTLAPATGAAPMVMSGVGIREDGKAKPAAKRGRKAGGRKKAGRRKAAGKKAPAAKKAAGRPAKGTGRVGRPPVNVGPCTVAGCGQPSKTRGLCSAHYQQHRRLVREGKPGLMRDGAGAAPAAAKPAPKARRAKKAGRRKAAPVKRSAAKAVAQEKAPAVS